MQKVKKIIKLLLKIIFYMWTLLMLILVLVPVGNDVPKADRILEKLSSIATVIVLYVPMILLALNIGLFKRIDYFSKKKLKFKVIFMVVSTIGLFVLYGISNSALQSRYSAEYKIILAKQEELEAKEAEEKKKQEELAAKEVEEKKKQEELAAKEVEEKKKQEELAAKEAEEKKKQEELAAKEAGEKKKQEELAAKEVEEKKKQEELAAKEAEEKKKQEELAAKEVEEKNKLREIVANVKDKLSLFQKSKDDKELKSFKKNVDKVVDREETEKFLSLLEQNNDNEERKEYILYKIEKKYKKEIKKNKKDIKEKNVEQLYAMVDKLSFVNDNKDILNSEIGQMYNYLYDLAETREAVVYIMNEKEPPRTSITDINDIVELDCYVNYRIKNEYSLGSINEYSDYYFISSYEFDPYNYDEYPTDDFQAVLEISQNATISKGKVSIKVKESGYKTLISEGFKTDYPLYIQVSEEDINNYYLQEEYKSRKKSFGDLVDKQDSLIKEIINRL